MKMNFLEEEPIQNQNPKEKDLTIQKLCFYSKFYEKIKLPFLSQIMDLCNFINFRMGSKLNLQKIHVASLAYFLQSIKGINDKITYAELIQKLNEIKHYNMKDSHLKTFS